MSTSDMFTTGNFSMKTQFALAASLVLTATAGSAQTITASSWFPPSHPMSTGLFDKFAEQAAAYSNGEIEVISDTGSALVTPRGALQSLADGLTDVTVHISSYTPSEMPVSNLLEEIALTLANENPYALTAAVTEFTLTNEAFQKEFAANGVVFASPYMTPPYALACRMPITSLADLEGKRIRSPNRSVTAWVQGVGATPVSMSSSEQYSALDKGALDCTAAALDDVLQRRLFEVVSHATDLPLAVFWAGFGAAWNKDTWTELSPEARRAMLNAHADGLASMVYNGVITAGERARSLLPDEGMTIHEPDAALVAKTDEIRAQVAEDAPRIAEEEVGIEDGKAFFDAFDARLDAWNARVEELGIDGEEAFAAMLRDEIYANVDVETYGID